MRVALVVLALTAVACEESAPPAAPVVAPSNGTAASAGAKASSAPETATAPATTTPADPESAAVAFGHLLARCDRDAALKASVSWEELGAMVTRVPEREVWVAPTREKIEKGCKTFATGTITGAHVTDRKHLTKAEDPEKFKRDIEAATVHLAVDGRELEDDMYFIQTERGWLYSAVH